MGYTLRRLPSRLAEVGSHLRDERNCAHPGMTAVTGYAMNMRAAEAIVSSAPKPIKIFPIREVWSQVELSLLLAAVTGAAGGGGGPGVGRAVSCSARSTSLS